LSLLPGLLVATALLVGACGSSSGGNSTSTTTSARSEPADTSSKIDPLAPVTFTDPSQPVSVGLGRRFQLLLPADPTRGWRWVLEPTDTTVVVPLSSEFRDDAALLASTSTTTTVVTQSPTATPSPSVTWEPTTTTTIEPDSPEAAPLVQIITFAGRSIATTEIVLRYEQIGANSSAQRRETFKVSVHANAE
jgi:hypothetical protein